MQEVFFPAPAIATTLMFDLKGKDGDNTDDTSSSLKQDVTTTDNGNRGAHLTPGSLLEVAGEITNAARTLLKRLLELDPKVRMKNIRQLQQTAFYMGFNFEHVKAKKVSPKIILKRQVPSSYEPSCEQEFASFDECKFPL